MSKIPSPHFQIEIWAIVFSISSLINLEIVYTWPIPKFRWEDLVYNSFFSSQSELHVVQNIVFFFNLS